MLTEKRQAAICHTMLEVIDNSDGGVPLVKIEEIMMKAVSFAAFIKAINILYDKGLITIDANYVAYRRTE